MTRVSVAELKARLSHYLRLAQAGETVEVRSHHHCVARMVPPSDDASGLVLRPERPVSDLDELIGIPLKAGIDPVASLLRDRAER